MAAKYKKLTVYYLLVEKVLATARRRMTAAEIRLFFRAVRTLGTHRGDPLHRYDENGEESRYIVFFNDLNSPRWNEAPGSETFLYAKRRDSGYPWEHTEDGDLIELQLHGAGNEVAEVTYAGLLDDPGVLFFVSNLYVGSQQSLQNYFNVILGRLREHGRYELELNGQPAHFELSFIKSPDPEAMLGRITDIKRWSLRIAGGIEQLTELMDRPGNTDAAMAGLARLAQETQTVNLNLEFTKGHRPDPLQKSRLRSILSALRPFFNLSPGKHQFEVEGMVADERTAVLDILNPRLIQKRDIKYEGKYPVLNEVFDELRETASIDRDTIKDGLGL